MSGKSLIERYNAKGAAGVRNLDGFYEITDGVYAPIRILRMDLESGCSPQFVCEVLGGRGELVLDSACQFIPADQLDATLAANAAAERKQEAIRPLTRYKMTVIGRRQALTAFIETYVPGQFNNDALSAEAESCGADLEDSRTWTNGSGRLDRLQRAAIYAAFGSDADE